MRVSLVLLAAGLALAVGVAAPVTADIVMNTVPVGDSGNANDDTGAGGVTYDYRIGKTEVTNAQYAAFLNAVATVGDPHGLYNTSMGNDSSPAAGGILRAGSGTGGDPYVYTIRGDRANRPVNYVNFWDACRFTNWLHNGQPTGGQTSATTEDGAYFLNGVTVPTNTSVSRKAGWKYAVPTESEWYKAAYYVGFSGSYYDYATRSNTVPTAQAPPGTNSSNGSANYYSEGLVDTTYGTTVVGSYTTKPSDSAYGTFDQTGNVWEWNEDIFSKVGTDDARGMRGGGYGTGNTNVLSANFQHKYVTTDEEPDVGFRVSQSLAEPDVYSEVVLADSPYAYYRLNEDPIVIGTIGADSSGNGRNLTYANSPTPVAGAFGTSGGAVAFDGSSQNTEDSNSAPNLRNLLVDGAATMTFETWIRTDIVPNGNNNYRLVHSYNGGGADSTLFQVFLDNTEADLRAMVGDSDGDRITGSVTNLPGLFDDEWHHLVVRYTRYSSTNAALDVFLDGVDQSAVVTYNLSGDSSFNDFNAFDNPVRLASAPGQAYFPGSLDEVAFYVAGNSLTDAEILEHYEARLLTQQSSALIPEPAGLGLVGLLGLSVTKGAMPGLRSRRS
jgi:formylglycine-generating enzyme required for sulfatase activity